MLVLRNTMLKLGIIIIMSSNYYLITSFVLLGVYFVQLGISFLKYLYHTDCRKCLAIYFEGATRVNLILCSVGAYVIQG